MIIKCQDHIEISVIVYDHTHKQKITKMAKKSQLKSIGYRAKYARFHRYGSLEAVL